MPPPNTPRVPSPQPSLHPSKKPPQNSSAALLLARQLKEIQTDKDKDIPGISVGLVDDGNIFEWEVMLMIQDDVPYYGGTYGFDM